MPPTSLHRSRLRRRAATGLVAAVVTGLAVAGTAAPAAAAGTGPLIGASAVDAVAQQPADPASQPRTYAGPARFPLVEADPAAAARVRRAGSDAQDGFYCTGSLDYNIHGIEQDDYLEERVDVDYSAEVDCNFYLNRIQGAAGVFDRSEDFDGQSFDGAVISVGTQIDVVEAYTGSSSGGYRHYVRQYDGGRRIEPAFELILLAPEGLNWGDCNLIPGLRYLACDGLGTRELHVVLGTGPLSTGLTKACRALEAPVDPEQERVRTRDGSTPASTQLLERVPALRQKVIDFKKDLCAVTSPEAGSTLAAQRGLELWQTAVAQAQAGTAAGDDRPLYWARLSLTRALSQWRPPFAVDRASLQIAVEKPSRGMTTDTFSGGGKKVFVSGFDPFQLDTSIVRGNPSGAVALALDGKSVGGAQVQTVMFPVRYDDFDARLVEQVVRPHLAPGPQQADLVVTTSQNGSTPRFDLEFYNGRSRGTGTDNRDRSVGPGEPGGLDAGAQFVPTTLPVDPMAAALAPPGNFPIIIDTSVQERVNGVDGNPSDGPTRGSMALAGSGGSYLSNEIAYRVTRLRDELSVTAVPAGHVHLPGTDAPAGWSDTDRGRIVSQFTAVLAAGVGAPAVPPVSVVADRSTYRVGQTPIYTVIGAPAEPVKWTRVHDGTVTEVNAVHGATNAAGTWTGSWHAWGPADVGSWTVTVRVGGRLAQVGITVEPAPPAREGVRADFDGDGSTDVSVWRPDNGTWYVTPTGGGAAFGTAGDLPVEGDFDGDGTADLAVYRPSTRTWHLQQSRDGYRSAVFGADGDLLVPADYDGDGRTDVATWRPGDGTWLVQRSDGGVTVIPFGQAGDRPAPGDYDGDGQADAAVYRPATGTWLARRSSDGQVTSTAFGVAEDRPEAADYDGDGRTDFAVFRPSTGTWHVLRSSDGALQGLAWGSASDIGVPGDYDGDRKADYAVFRPSDATWYLHLATGEARYVAYGRSTDVPIPGVDANR